MKQTDNYGLVLYDLEDKFVITAEEKSFNASMKKIDSALKEKANNADITALTNLEIENLLEQQV